MTTSNQAERVNAWLTIRDAYERTAILGYGAYTKIPAWMASRYYDAEPIPEETDSITERIEAAWDSMTRRAPR